MQLNIIYFSPLVAVFFSFPLLCACACSSFYILIFEYSKANAGVAVAYLFCQLFCQVLLRLLFELSNLWQRHVGIVIEPAEDLGRNKEMDVGK